jgi:hypothetical protein
MGDFWEDVANVATGGAYALTKRAAEETVNVINTVNIASINMTMGIVKSLENIDWTKVTDNIGKGVGYVFVDLNPYHILAKALSEYPLTSHLYKGYDELLGGVLSTFDNLVTLEGRAARGDAITKEELVQDALLIVRVAMVYFAGPVGSAAYNAMFVAQAAGQLKQGTLGKSQLGRDILGLAEVAGYAYYMGASVEDAATKYAQDKAKQEGQSYVLKNTALGRGELGPYIAGLAFAEIGTSDSYATLTTFSNQYATNQAINTTATRIGGPFGRQIATATVGAAKNGQFDPSGIDFSKVPQGYSFNQFLQDVQNGYGNVKDGLVNFMNRSGGQSGFPGIDFTGSGDAITKFGVNAANEILKVPTNIAVELSRIPENVVGMVKNISYPSLSSPTFPGLSVPDVKSPSFDFSINIDWEAIFNVLTFLGKKALYRKRGVKGQDGKLYTVYVLEDGSLYYELENGNGMLWLLLAAAGAAVAVSS